MRTATAITDPTQLIKADGTMMGIGVVLGRGVSGSGHALVAAISGHNTKFGISSGQDFYAQYVRAVDCILKMRGLDATPEQRALLYETRHALLAQYGIKLRMVETLDFSEAKKRGTNGN
jgi:hypothetical protein